MAGLWARPRQHAMHQRHQGTTADRASRSPQQVSPASAASKIAIDYRKTAASLEFTGCAAQESSAPTVRAVEAATIRTSSDRAELLVRGAYVAEPWRGAQVSVSTLITSREATSVCKTPSAFAIRRAFRSWTFGVRVTFMQPAVQSV